jgi:hypothetical protein
MTTATEKVGDVLPWDAVPMATMVRRTWKYHGPEFYVKRRDGSARVRDEDGRWVDSRRLNGNFTSDEMMTIAALNLTCDETDDELNNLAVEFEGRSWLDPNK